MSHANAPSPVVDEGVPSSWGTARTHFERAAGGSGSEMLWRIADACPWVPLLAAHWMSRAVFSESDAGGIEAAHRLRT